MSDKKETQIITSDTLVKELDDQTVLLARNLLSKQITPHLAVVAVGDTVDSPFIRYKKSRGRSLGIVVSVYTLPETASVGEVEKVIKFLNQDPEIAGIIVQLPLPKQFDKKQVDFILNAIDASKDVDGLGKGKIIAKAKDIIAMQDVAILKGGYLPTTAHAMLLLANEYKLNLNDGLLVIGKGRLVGNPLIELLSMLSIKCQQVDKESKELNNAIFSAKVIMAGTNTVDPFLDESFVQERAYVIAAGNEIDHKSLDGYAEAITPKKGGVGPLTISLLFINTVRACLTKTDER